jgi:hypothetical protein
MAMFISFWPPILKKSNVDDPEKNKTKKILTNY